MAQRDGNEQLRECVAIQPTAFLLDRRLLVRDVLQELLREAERFSQRVAIGRGRGFVAYEPTPAAKERGTAPPPFRVRVDPGQTAPQTVHASLFADRPLFAVTAAGRRGLIDKTIQLPPLAAPWQDAGPEAVARAVLVWFPEQNEYRLVSSPPPRASLLFAVPLGVLQYEQGRWHALEWTPWNGFAANIFDSSEMDDQRAETIADLARFFSSHASRAGGLADSLWRLEASIGEAEPGAVGVVMAARSFFRAAVESLAHYTGLPDSLRNITPPSFLAWPVRELGGLSACFVSPLSIAVDAAIAVAGDLRTHLEARDWRSRRYYARDAEVGKLLSLPFGETADEYEIIGVLADSFSEVPGVLEPSASSDEILLVSFDGPGAARPITTLTLEQKAPGRIDSKATLRVEGTSAQSWHQHVWRVCVRPTPGAALRLQVAPEKGPKSSISGVVARKRLHRAG